MDAQTRERLEELERALHLERAAHRRERELAAQALKRCELLEESVRRAYRLVAIGCPLASASDQQIGNPADVQHNAKNREGQSGHS